MITICSACNKLILPGEQATSTKGRHRRPIKMHRDCWAKRKAMLNDPVHLAVSKHYRLTGAACVKCGSTEDIQADHIVSREAGGTNDLSNYQPLCGPCNRKKGGS